MIDAILHAVEGMVTSPWVYLALFAVATLGGSSIGRRIRAPREAGSSAHREILRAACP
jgi:hypothetical protein